MMNFFLRSGAVFLVAGWMSLGAALAAEVTSERLLHATGEAQNWLMHSRTYDGHRFSPLDQINRETIGQVKLLASIPIYALRTEDTQTGGNYAEAQQSSPLVEDGTLYLVDGWGRVYGVDLRARAIAWVAETGQDNINSWAEAKRGLALYGDWVISIAPDGKLHWIDRETGVVTRTVQVDDPLTGYTIAAPPLVVGDRLILGGAGGDRGAAVHIDALDAATGAPIWRTAAVGDGAVNAGGSVLQTGTFDPQSGLTYWSVGEGFLPYGPAGVAAGGANSLIALDAATGAVRWRFAMPSVHGADEIGSPMLVRGEDGILGARLAANGQFYRLDGASGEVVSALSYVDRQEVAGEPTRFGAFCPNVLGAPGMAASFSEITGLIYGGSADDCEAELAGAGSADGVWPGAKYAGANAAGGLMVAADPATGEIVARHRFAAPVHAGAVATAGGLVFTTTADGKLHALDDRTLEPLWELAFTSLSSAPPISFAVDGKQYIALIISGNSYASRLGERPDSLMHAQPLFVLALMGIDE